LLYRKRGRDSGILVRIMMGLHRTFFENKEIYSIF
jgi:hypothetical protein